MLKINNTFYDKIQRNEAIFQEYESLFDKTEEELKENQEKYLERMKKDDESSDETDESLDEVFNSFSEDEYYIIQSLYLDENENFKYMVDSLKSDPEKLKDIYSILFFG